MVRIATLSILAKLEQEMDRARRSPESEALREALNALAKAERGFLTTGQAAERLGISIPTVKRWIERGTLGGGEMNGRWVVSKESVDRVLRLRGLLVAMDGQGNPTPEEISALKKRVRGLSAERRG